MFQRFLPVTTLVLSLSFFGCDGDEHDDTDDEYDPAAHACEHVDEAGTAITAGATMDATAPEIDLSGEGIYTITLVDSAAGYVRLESDEDHEIIFFLDTADVVQTAYLDGTEVTLPATSPNSECSDDLPDHFHLDAEPGTWHIELGPAAVTSVWLMLVEGGEHEHHEDE